MAAAPPRLQQALADRYRIERELGRGGMATVYLAQDLKYPRRVAIKVMDPELAAAVGAERFLREIEVAARLTHPHILPFLDSGSADGLLYYVMPYAEGESLRQKLRQEKQLPVAEALRITREVAGALDYSHRSGLVHRDIKPENILFLEQHAVVADFGIARALTSAGDETLTATGILIGTPIYMSPEQAGGSRSLDGRSDLYSLGCVLYEMLAGQPPFTAPTAESLSHQHLSVTPRPVRELRPSVPEEVDRAIARTLAKAAADRFGSAAEFAAALVPSEGSVSTPPGLAALAEAKTVDSAVTKHRRWRRFALLGGAAVLVSAGAWFAWSRIVHAPTPPEPAPAVKPTLHERTEIAVLPFQDLSADAAHSYFAGGLQDELLTQLSKVAALKVISRTSVMGYQGTSKKLQQIAEELGVGSVVEGSVQVVGGRLRVNVQLIDAATDEHLWAEHYDHTLDDAFAIQSEVAQKIVEAVGAALSSAEQSRLRAAPTANAEAYSLYLQGNDYLGRTGLLKQNLETAQQLFERALALDPNFALAHALLSRTHGFLYWNRGRSPAHLAQARAEAEAALRLAPDLPEAHFAMGWAEYVSLAYRRSADEFAIALRGLPNDAVVWRFSGLAHRRLGNWTEVLAAFDRAAQLNPRDADLFFWLGGHTYRYLRRYPEAVRAYQRALSLAPDVKERVTDIGWTYVIWQGQLDTLRAALDRLPRDADLGNRMIGLRAEFMLYERSADSLLQMPGMASPNLFVSETSFRSSALYAAWAHRLRGDHVAARAAFDSARVHLDSWLKAHEDDWDAHYSRGMALAGLGRRSEALREARWLKHTVIYREDAVDGPYVASDRALILAQVGEADAAIDELERLLARPSEESVHTLRLYPLWDPIREHPRFKALLAKYGS